MNEKRGVQALVPVQALDIFDVFDFRGYAPMTGKDIPVVRTNHSGQWQTLEEQDEPVVNVYAIFGFALVFKAVRARDDRALVVATYEEYPSKQQGS